MKKFSHLVICPKCSKAFEMEEIIRHLDSHSLLKQASGAVSTRAVQEQADKQGGA